LNTSDSDQDDDQKTPGVANRAVTGLETMHPHAAGRMSAHAGTTSSARAADIGSIDSRAELDLSLRNEPRSVDAPRTRLQKAPLAIHRPPPRPRLHRGYSAVMPYAGNIATFRVLLGGYRQAVERFLASTLDRDPIVVFRPLFEALNWSVALDDQARQHWAPEGRPLDWQWRELAPGGGVVDAVRCARNRVHHQWADALVRTDGAIIPRTLPFAFHEWRWRPLRELPPATTPTAPLRAAESSYENLLAGQPARLALQELLVPFDYVAERLEPLLPNPPSPATS